MKKQFISLIVALLVLFSFSSPVFAAENSHITDEVDQFAFDEIERLDQIAKDYESELGIGFYYAYIADKLENFDPSAAVFSENYVFLVEDDYSWWIKTNGTADNYIGQAEKYAIWDEYSSADSYYGAVVRFFDTCASIIKGDIQVKDDPDIFPSSFPGRLFDGADLLTSSEESALLSRLNEVSEQYKTDFVIVTVDTVGSYSANAYIEEFFDRFSYGGGNMENGGVMLLLSMKERDYRILSDGIVGDTIGDSEIEDIGDYIVSDLSSGYYKSAFNSFISRSEYYVNGAINGFPFNFVPAVVFSVIVGFIVSLISVNSMKKKLKTVNPVNEANSYLREGSLNLVKSNDMFLYATVSRTARSKSSSSSRSRSGGGSRHVGGGKF